MTVRWQTDSLPVISTSIAWGLTPNYELGNSTVAEDAPDPEPYFFSQPITGLPDDTLVYYQVYVDGTVRNGSFRTRPSRFSSQVSFYGYGDIRGDATTCSTDVAYQVHSQVEAAMMADVGSAPADAAPRQTLLINVGDFVRIGLAEKYWDVQYFNPNDPYLANPYVPYLGGGTTGSLGFLANMPSLGAIGNHEGYQLNSPNADTCTGDTSHTTDWATAGKLYYRYWPYPMYHTPKQAGAYNDYYYSVDYGPAKFLFLDTSYSGNNDDQLSWFNDNIDYLAAWNIPVMHIPMWAPTYASAAHSDKATSEALRAKFEATFKQRGVPLVLQGHVHYYSRIEKDGIVYLMLGGGGAELNHPNPRDYDSTSGPLPTNNDYDPTSAPYVKKVVSSDGNYSFARFDIVGNLMNVTVYDRSNAVLDSFSVSSYGPAVDRPPAADPRRLFA